jgi:Tol biopolymer transport system component
LQISDTSGSHWRTLTRTPHARGLLGGLSWSPNGATLVFGKGFFDSAAVYAVPAQGGKAAKLKGTRHGANPVFSPQGSSVAFVRFRYRREHGQGPYLSTSLWLADLERDDSRQLTHWRHDFHLVPSSFSPDGEVLLATRVDEREQSPEIVALPIRSRQISPVIRSGIEPSYSPDGSKIAFVRYSRTERDGRYGQGSDLYVAAADGSATSRLTFSPARREASPSWDPSGQRLAYTQFPSKQTWRAQEGIGSAIVEINTDGTCRHRLLFTSGISYREPTWQPGPGREAGRVEC